MVGAKPSPGEPPEQTSTVSQTDGLQVQSLSFLTYLYVCFHQQSRAKLLLPQDFYPFPHFSQVSYYRFSFQTIRKRCSTVGR